MMFFALLMMISLCLTPSKAHDIFTPENKENPLELHYDIPEEKLGLSGKKGNTPRITIYTPDPKDFCCDKEVIKEFNKEPESYVDDVRSLRGDPAAKLVNYRLVKSVHVIENRVSKVMLENLRLLKWVQIVKFLNNNLRFRDFLYGDQPLVKANSTFSNWNYSSNVNDIFTYTSKSVFLPRPIGPISPFGNTLKAIAATQNLEFELEPHFQQVPCKTDVTAKQCLIEQFTKVNARFKLFEDIIDAIRAEFGKTERSDSHSRLFNPVARWFA